QIAARDVVAQRRLAGRMEADRHLELLDRAPERLEPRVVDVPTADRVRVADDGNRAQLAHGAPGFADRQRDVLECDLGGELQAARGKGAEVARPVVVGPPGGGGG